SRVNPIVCIARAVAPMLPGWLVRTSTIRKRVKRSTAGGFDVGNSRIRTPDGHRHRERHRCTVEYRSIALSPRRWFTTTADRENSYHASNAPDCGDGCPTRGQQ